MKKLMLLAAVAVFGFTTMNAQEVKFGAKAGLNLASIGGDDVSDLKSRTAFHIGAVAEIGISDKFAVQPELLYSAQGAKADQGDGEIKLDYISIPVMAKYMVADGFAIEAGPQVGILASAKLDDGTDEVDVKDEVSGIDFGVGLGASYRLESGLNFAARYNLGLSNINDFEGSDNFKNQNNVFQISVGYFFN
ncbi:porin family protein [uncultured Psychroserpens sp.]|uniref:porin family protein n=1 Tax=uncultured Psychroserpens sp. TaxID=255436 RepID=UPI002604597A|nr:porin family protein [uncultured Psychroserpens sp.]